MLTLLLRCKKHIEKTGCIRSTHVDAIRAYGRRHPMWRLVATEQMIVAHDAILRNFDAA